MDWEGAVQTLSTMRRHLLRTSIPWLALTLLGGCTVYQTFPGHGTSSSSDGGSSNPVGSGGAAGGSSVAPTWHWESPSPATVSPIHAISGTAKDDVWFAGDGGAILRWDGAHLTSAYAGAPSDRFAAVWASGPKDVWAAGDRSVAHWDGAVWSTSYALRDHAVSAIWGASSNDVWAATDAGLAQWQGGAWTFPDTSQPTVAKALWGTGAHDVWAVGDGGLIVHHDDEWDSDGYPGWTRAPASDATDPSHQFVAVGGVASDDVWAVYNKGHSNDGFIQPGFAHWDGQAWSVEAEPAEEYPSMPFGGAAVVAMAPDDVYAMPGDGYPWHWDGATWTMVTGYGLVLAPTAMWGSPSAGVFFGNDFGQAFRYEADSGALQAAKELSSGERLDMAPVNVTADGSVWGQACSYRFVSGAWKETDVPLWYTHGCDARSADDVWVAGEIRVNAKKYVAGIAHWDGKSWGKAVPLPDAGDALSDVRFVDDTHAFAVSKSSLLAWDGATWKTIHTQPKGARRLWGLWASSANDVWISTSNGVVRWDGDQIVQLPGGPTGPGSFSEAANGDDGPGWHLSGTGPNDVWACGTPTDSGSSGASACWRWNGDAWHVVALDTDQPATSVWAHAPNDVWVITTNETYGDPYSVDVRSTIHHFDGAKFDSTFEVAGGLGSIAGTRADDVWAVGGCGLTLHLHGAESPR